MSDLTNTIAETTLTQNSLNYRRNTLVLESLNNTPGPSNWEEVTVSDFGPEQDFDTEDHGSIVVFDCYSNAALQWCYAHLPEDCPRWGAHGFAIEEKFVGAIIEGARRDGLMSRQDFEAAMNEEQEQRRQWS